MLRVCRWWRSLSCPQVTFLSASRGELQTEPFCKNHFQEHRKGCAWGHRSTEESHLKVRNPGSAAARHCPLREVGSWTASAVREMSKSSVLSTLWHMERPFNAPPGAVRSSWVPAAPWASRKELLHTTFTRQQLAEPWLLHTPAEQLAPVIHLVRISCSTGRACKKHASHLPACLCLPSWLSPAQEGSSLRPA